MAHNHSHHHHLGHHHDHSAHGHAAARVLGFTFFLNLAFVGIEIAGGIFTGSVAILADALHDLGDCLSLAIAWGLQKLSTKSRTKEFSYGYGRLSLLSAVLSGIIIAIGSVVILITAIPRITAPGEPHGLGMMVVALFGVSINGFAAYHLTRGKTAAEKVLLWHYVEDVLGWVAVLVGAFFVYWKEWYWVDSVLAVGIAAFIFWNVIKTLHRTVKLFLQSVPEEFDSQKFLTSIREISGVKDVHDLHIWSLDGAQHILSLHIQISDGKINTIPIKEKIREIACSMGNYHTTIEVELPNEGCHDIC